MEIVLEKDLNKDINMSSVEFKGILDANYSDLVSAFGTPDVGDQYKTDVQWKLRLKTEHGSCSVVLYNYKSGKNYIGKHGLSLKQIPNWHVKATKSTHINVVASLEQFLKEKNYAQEVDKD